MAELDLTRFNDKQLYSAADFNRLVDNDEYFLSALPTFFVETGQQNLSSNIAIEAGRVNLLEENLKFGAAPNNRVIVTEVFFNAPFASRPVVVAQFVSAYDKTRNTTTSICGLSGAKDVGKAGFRAYVIHSDKEGTGFPTEGSIPDQFRLHYIAIGLRA